MSTMRCAVIVLASIPGAAGLLHPGPMDPFDFTGDSFDAAVDFDVELAADGLKRDLADTVCRSYERPPQYQPQFLGRGEGVGVEPTFAELDGGAQVDMQKLGMLGKTMKVACFGSSWNGNRCWFAVNAIRSSIWSRLIASTQGDSTFRHLRSHWEVPHVKQFSQGGGMAADIPCRPGGGKAHLYYRHIWKVAGKAIEKNLALLSHSPVWESNDANWTRNRVCEEFDAAQNYTSPKPVLFTFVREPMAKFIAGFREIASRGLIDIIRGTEVGTVEHAKLFLDDVFHGSCDNGHLLLQIQNMFGPSCESHFDYIGKLENFSSHWQELGETAGCKANLDWPENWAHPSESDDKGADAEAALRMALAASGGKLARALCIWLLPDYVAFDYPLPEQCEEHADLMQVAGSF